MPNRPSAVKAMRRSKTRQMLNKSVKSRLHTETKKFERAVERSDPGEAALQLELVTKLLHKAVGKGVLHKNTAARKQSRLQSHMNAMTEKTE